MCRCPVCRPDLHRISELFGPEPEMRRSRRLAAKPAVSYYEAPIPSEAAIRRRDQRRAEAAIVRNAQRVQRRAEAAVLRETMRKIRQTERLLRQVERDAEILASMPATPPRLERSAAEAPWAPPRGPALSRTEATGCADWQSFEWTEAPLAPPSPLRRTCASPDCDEHCALCRGNDRLAAANRGWNPLAEPRPTSIPRLPIALGANSSENSERRIGAPPIGATVVRVPVDLATLTRAALQQIIAAANSALASKP